MPQLLRNHLKRLGVALALGLHFAEALLRVAVPQPVRAGRVFQGALAGLGEAAAPGFPGPDVVMLAVVDPAISDLPGRIEAAIFEALSECRRNADLPHQPALAVDCVDRALAACEAVRRPFAVSAGRLLAGWPQGRQLMRPQSGRVGDLGC